MGSVVEAHRLYSMCSVVVVLRLSCSEVCGIFLEQGSNLCPLHWQADSYPLHHRGSPPSHLIFTKASLAPPTISSGPTKTFFSYEGPPLFLDRISNQEWNTKEIQPSAWEPRPWSKMNLGCNWDLSILLITLIKLIVCPLVSCSISLRICSKFMPKCEE